ncbi:MAG TPA: hypothetical protein VE988_17135 [Gemmataceae bacterium]|nr:hypothetical protein [Gemmataceae bacterium]
MPALTQAEVFSRVFQPEKPNLSAQAARSILALDFCAEDRARVNALAEKARQGKLSKREDDELETFIHVGHLVAIMQSKARLSLKNNGSGR